MCVLECGIEMDIGYYANTDAGSRSCRCRSFFLTCRWAENTWLWISQYITYTLEPKKLVYNCSGLLLGIFLSAVQE